jgi:hypothetical protein
LGVLVESEEVPHLAKQTIVGMGVRSHVDFSMWVRVREWEVKMVK